jgi:predicted transcriptional regulator
MDNSQGAELKREVLLKVFIGDESISRGLLSSLQQLGLIRRRENAPKRGGRDAWHYDLVTDFELTAKGLARLHGD